MPTSTYIALANLTLTGTDTSIVFSSIPATYRDLVLVYDVTLGADGNTRIRLNSDNGSNYSTVWAYGSGSTALSSSETTTSANLEVSNFTNFNGLLNLMDYSATDKHKTMLSRNNNAGEFVTMSAHRWANTNAVTSVEIFTSASSFASGSTFALYGIIS